MLFNLSSKYSVKARDNDWGGIYCRSIRGPSFGDCELVTFEPFLGKDNVYSYVERDGYMIPGKVGDTNPLTGDIIAK
jgi:hypothetical protein